MKKTVPSTVAGPGGHHVGRQIPTRCLLFAQGTFFLLPSSGSTSPPSPQAQRPHLGRQQVVELGSEIELDALPGSWEGDSSDQQHEQDEVGERGCEIHHLRDDRRGQRAAVTFFTLYFFQKRPPHYFASTTFG